MLLYKSGISSDSLTFAAYLLRPRTLCCSAKISAVEDSLLFRHVWDGDHQPGLFITVSVRAAGILTSINSHSPASALIHTIRLLESRKVTMFSSLPAMFSSC